MESSEINITPGYLIGIDIGTTTSKGVIVTPQKKTIAACSIEHEVDRPHPGWAEHDAEKVWWGDFVNICRTLLQQSSVNPQQLLAVGCSTISPVILPVDKNGRPLRKGILYSIDTRVTDDYSIKATNNQFSSQIVLPKILWIKRHEPELFKKTFKFLYASSYVVYRLTNNYVVDHGSGSNGGLPYNINTMNWDEEACHEVGISPDQLPRLMFGDGLAGRVSTKAAAETGLPEGLPVAAGTVDHACEVISLGASKKGRTVIAYGTSLCLDVCVEQKLYYPGLMLSRGSMSKEIYYTGGALSSGAGLTKWFKDNFGHVEIELERQTGLNAYQSLSNAAGKVKPGSEGLIVLPYFSGERFPIHDTQARGVIFGLTLRHTRGHLYRAIMESVAYGVRHLLDTLKAGGVTAESVTIVGGGTLSDVWTQIVSDVSQIEQRIQAESGAQYGAAYLGGLAAGVIDPSYIDKLWDSYQRIVKPDPANKAIYDKYYQIYRSLYPKTVDEMHLLG
jgi:xylulokinase